MVLIVALKTFHPLTPNSLSGHFSKLTHRIKMINTLLLISYYKEEENGG